MRERFIDKKLGSRKMALITIANGIIDDYQAQGFTLTLRQLYYQFVSKDLIPNTERSYKQLGTAISDGRLCGYIDWDAIEDRTRHIEQNSHWSDPAAIVDSCINSYAIDKWANQHNYVEVWIEKEALVGVIEGICKELDVVYFACRGYNSQSEQYQAAKRLERARNGGREPNIIHLGDHDPSGIDMTRDNSDRLELMSYSWLDVNRIALNMDQVEEYSPPPNPTKLSDSRANDYVADYGYECWELDALEPSVIVDLIRDSVLELRDEDLWQEMVDEEEAGRDTLRQIKDNLEE